MESCACERVACFCHALTDVISDGRGSRETVWEPGTRVGGSGEGETGGRGSRGHEEEGESGRHSGQEERHSQRTVRRWLNAQIAFCPPAL